MISADDDVLGATPFLLRPIAADVFCPSPVICRSASRSATTHNLLKVNRILCILLWLCVGWREGVAISLDKATSTSHIPS